MNAVPDVLCPKYKRTPLLFPCKHKNLYAEPHNKKRKIYFPGEHILSNVFHPFFVRNWRGISLNSSVSWELMNKNAYQILQTRNTFGKLPSFACGAV
jgi:hypothetical protein